MAATHELKTWPEPFRAVVNFRKQFEYRKNDRNFQEGDIILLREWKPETEQYTGLQVEVEVTYIIHGPAFGVPTGYCVMSIDRGF